MLHEPASFCAAPGPGLEGDHCDAGCGTGLVCAFGTCLEACLDGACSNGDCVDLSMRLDGLELAVCNVTCDPIAQKGCAPDEVCLPTDEDDPSP